MSGVYEDMDRSTPADIADRWFARLMAPDCTKQERAQFDSWLHEDPEHLLAYENTKALWASLEGLDGDEVVGPFVASALVGESTPFITSWAQVEHRARARAKAPRRWTSVSIAASLLVLVVAGGALFLQYRAPKPYGIAYSTTDQIRNIQLPDGSVLQLDIETSVSVDLEPEFRSIVLEHGRALFRVAHNVHRPFVVDAGPGRITALGTQFQVLREGENISVALVEGSVAINNPRDPEDQRSLRLIPGQEAKYSPSSQSWEVASVDSTQLTSWSHGFHVFSATPLADAVKEINRYSPIKLRIGDPSLEQLVISGSFRLGDSKSIADVLHEVLPVKSEERQGEIVLLRR